MTFGDSKAYTALAGVSKSDAFNMVVRAFDAGVDLFDTADGYLLEWGVQSDRITELDW